MWLATLFLLILLEPLQALSSRFPTPIIIYDLSFPVTQADEPHNSEEPTTPTLTKDEISARVDCEFPLEIKQSKLKVWETDIPSITISSTIANTTARACLNGTSHFYFAQRYFKTLWYWLIRSELYLNKNHREHWEGRDATVLASGGWERRKIDGIKESRKPETTAIKALIQFIKATGRFQSQTGDEWERWRWSKRGVRLPEPLRGGSAGFNWRFLSPEANAQHRNSS